MTPDQIAEAFERARYEQLRGSVWSDLREGERSARVEVARRAFGEAGLTRVLEELQSEAARAADLDGLLAQRDAEIARRRSEHEAELAELRTTTAAAAAALTVERDAAVARLELERDTAVADLEAELGEVRAALAASRAHGRLADARADAAEHVVAAVTAALAGAAAPVETDDHSPGGEPETPDNHLSAQDAAHPATNARGRFGRLARGAARA